MDLENASPDIEKLFNETFAEDAQYDADASQNEEGAESQPQTDSGHQAANPVTDASQQQQVVGSQPEVNTGNTSQPAQNNVNAGGDTAPKNNILHPHASTANASEAEKLYSDTAGNLVNAKGEIVYAKGRERRVYENNHSAQQHVTGLTARITELQAENQQLKSGGSLEQIAQTAGIQPDDVTTAVNFMGQYRRDPLSTIQSMIAQTVQMGYNMDAILGGPNGEGVTRAMQQPQPQQVATANVSNTQVSQTPANDAENFAQEQFDMFQRTYANETRLHGDVIQKMLPSMPGNTLFEKASNAVQQLYQIASRDGFDMQLPLMEQLRQREQQNAANPQTGSVPQTRQAHPEIPNTSAGANGPGAIQHEAAPNVASVDTSFDDIIRESMRSAGMTT